MFREALYAAYRVARRFALYEVVYTRFRWLEKYLAGAGIRLPYRIYAALLTVAPPTATLLAALFFHLYLHATIPEPWRVHSFLMLALNALAGFAAGSLVFVALIYTPVLMYGNRASIIDARLPAFYSILAALSVAGLPPVSLITKAYKSRDLTGIDVEFEWAARLIGLGRSPPDALRWVAEITPSRQLSHSMVGLSTLLESGYGVSEHLKNLLDESIKNLEAKLKRLIDGLSLYMELYIAIGVVMPLLTSIILMFLGGIGTMPFDPNMFMGLIMFVLLPAFFAAIIVMVDMAISGVRET